MIVEQIMSRRLVSVEMDDRLADVREIFVHAKFHHLMVVEDSVLVGVISDRDLLKAISPNLGKASETYKDSVTLNKRVHQIMTRKPITLHPEASVLDAVNLFLSDGISCIPIVDHNSRPVGILSWRDILRALMAVHESSQKSAS